MLHFGKKHWWINNPKKAPHALMQLARPWDVFSRRFDDFKESQLPEFSCTQLPGEIMYMPEYWWHATMNMGETMGSGVQEDPIPQADTNTDSNTDADSSSNLRNVPKRQSTTIR